MKKLMILMLVFGMASLVNAQSVQLVVDAGTPVPDVGTGGTIQINVVADFDCIGFEMGLATSTDGAGRVPGSPGENTPVSSPVSWAQFDPGYVINSAYSQPGLLFDASSASSGFQTAGNPIASFDYIIPSGWSSEFTIGFAAEGTPYLDGFGDPYNAGPSYASDITAVGYLISGVTIVPEPTTIALLGLGGLLLRRRKK